MTGSTGYHRKTTSLSWPARRRSWPLCLDHATTINLWVIPITCLGSLPIAARPIKGGQAQKAPVKVLDRGGLDKPKPWKSCLWYPHNSQSHVFWYRSIRSPHGSWMHVQVGNDLHVVFAGKQEFGKCPHDYMDRTEVLTVQLFISSLLQSSSDLRQQQLVTIMACTKGCTRPFLSWQPNENGALHKIYGNTTSWSRNLWNSQWIPSSVLAQFAYFTIIRYFVLKWQCANIETPTVKLLISQLTLSEWMAHACDFGKISANIILYHFTGCLDLALNPGKQTHIFPHTCLDMTPILLKLFTYFVAGFWSY